MKGTISVGIMSKITARDRIDNISIYAHNSLRLCVGGTQRPEGLNEIANRRCKHGIGPWDPISFSTNLRCRCSLKDKFTG